MLLSPFAKHRERELVDESEEFFASLEQAILFFFVFFLPSQLAYHFWPDFSYVFGLRVDYLAPSLSLMDIFFVLLLPFLFIRLKKQKKSKLFIVPFLVVVLAALNTPLAVNPAITFLKWATLVKLSVVGLYFYNCDLKNFKKIIRSALTLSVLAVSFIGIYQVWLHRTIGGLFYYLGERSFTAETPGIALVSLFGKSLMRAYSIFSHPNSFAGFLVVSFLMILSLRRKMPRRNKYPILLLLVSGVSFLLTFSFGAFLGIIILLVLVKISKKYLIFLPLVFIGFSLLTGLGANFISDQRILLAKASLEVFSQRPILGVGLNNFLTQLPTTEAFNKILIIQPVHNIYLLVLAETGILGLLPVFILLILFLKNIKNTFLLSAFLFVLVTGLFDHYWLTLPQNTLLLSILIGFSLRRDISAKL